MANIAELNVSIGADLREIKYALAELKGNLKSVKKDTDGIGKAFDGVKGAIAGALSVGTLISFGKAIIDTTSEFEKFEAVLTNTLGSKSLAQAAIANIQEFAAKTPFSVKELTDSFVRLANQGFKPTQDEMRKLGDLASSTGKDFLQLTEAIIDAQTGEFERLKEFGIKASKQGDKVTFAFKGVKTQVDFTNESITKYITGLGDIQGVSGSMAAISETLGGKISNLGDSLDNLFNTIGGKGSGIFGFFIQQITDTINALAALGKTSAQVQQELKNKTLAKFAEEWEKLTLVELENVEKSKQNARIRAIIAKDSTQIKFISEQIHLIQDLINKKKQEAEQSNVEIGLLESLRLQLKKTTEAREKSTSQVEILGYNNRITKIQEEIKLLEELSNKRVGKVDKISPVGFDTKPLIPENKGLGFSIELDTINQVAAAMAIATNKADVFGDSFNLAAEKSAILNDALNYLVENGVSTNSYAIDVLKSQMENLGQVTVDVSGLIKQTLTDALIAVGEGIGQMAAGTQSVGGFFDNILLVVIDFVSSFGKLLIGAGIAAEAFQKALIENPYVAIAAGVALVAAAALVKGVLKKGPGGKTPALAQGGLAYGPTLAMVGDNKNAKSDPEVIAPLSKLKSIMGDSGGNVNVTGEFRISGSDLVATVEKQNRREGRVYGS